MKEENTQSGSPKKGIIIALVAALVGATGLGIGFLANSGSSTPETPISAPSPSPTTPSTTPAPVEKLDFLACAVSSTSGWSDVFGDSALYAGITEAGELLNINVELYESGRTATVYENLEAAANDSCDLVFTAGMEAGEYTVQAAKAFPETNFISIDSEIEGSDNLLSVVFDIKEASYLAGYLAAAQSNTKVVGTFGGFPLPVVTQYMDGFSAGAKAYGIDNDIKVTVLGWNSSKGTGSFTKNFAPNSPEAARIVEEMVNKGADVILPIAGSQYDVIQNAYAQAGISGLVIGVDIDLVSSNPDYASFVLTSVEKKIARPVYDVIAQLVAGEPFPGKTYEATLENDGVGLSAFYEFEDAISDSIKTALTEVASEINNGERSISTK